MTLLLSRVESAIVHALGMSALPPEISVLEVQDRAGKWLCGHPWTWLTRSGQVGTLAAVDSIDLSAALSGIRQVVSAYHQQSWMEPTSFERINELRSDLTAATGSPYTYAISTALSGAGAFSLQMELWRTPSQTVANAIRVVYRAGYAGPASLVDTARIPVPEDWEGLFLEACIAYAQGLEERDLGGPSLRLEALKDSDQYKRLMRQDGMTQSNFGQIQGGGAAAESIEFSTDWRGR